MAKRKTYTINEFAEKIQQEGLLEEENVSMEEIQESYIELLDADDHLREQVASLRARGFDNNRIAAKLMVSIHKIKSI